LIDSKAYNKTILIYLNYLINNDFQNQNQSYTQANVNQTQFSQQFDQGQANAFQAQNENLFSQQNDQEQQNENNGFNFFL
jgi:hypothetical protein